eukprot:gene8904-biopygen22672
MTSARGAGLGWYPRETGEITGNAKKSRAITGNMENHEQDSVFSRAQSRVEANHGQSRATSRALHGTITGNHGQLHGQPGRRVRSDGVLRPWQRCFWSPWLLWSLRYVGVTNVTTRTLGVICNPRVVLHPSWGYF